MDKSKLKNILIKADSLQKGKELGLAKEFVSLDEKIGSIEKGVNEINVSVDKKLSDLSEELKKKLEEELLYEVDEEKIAENVLSRVVIPIPKDGDKGDKGDPGNDGKDGKDGAKGDKGDKGNDGKDGEKGADGSPDEPIDIKNKLESLKEDDRLDASAIKNLPTNEVGARGRIVRVAHDSTLTGDGTESDPLHVVDDDDGFELLLNWKVGNNSYMEYTEVGGNITQVNYWTDSGKGTKLFTKDITYSGSNPTTVVTKDEISGKILTSTIAYSGDTILSVTKALA